MFPLAVHAGEYFGRRVGVVESRALATTSGALTSAPRDRKLFGDDVTVRRAGDLLTAGLPVFRTWVSRSALREGLQRLRGCGSCDCSFSIDYHPVTSKAASAQHQSAPVVNTYSELTSHNLWSRYDSHFVGIARYLRSYGAKM